MSRVLTSQLDSTMQAYCVKCRAKREIKSAKAITMKNGKAATQGVCPVCGTKMFRIGKA
jgi:Zn finger protein HypA/HybF involved in hydrogenase expression